MVRVKSESPIWARPNRCWRMPVLLFAEDAPIRLVQRKTAPTVLTGAVMGSVGDPRRTRT
jgi:hypothetical protein